MDSSEDDVVAPTTYAHKLAEKRLMGTIRRAIKCR